MKARRSRPNRTDRPAAASSPLRGGWVREEGGWLVRSVSGTAATKTYRCPGCQQEIVPGTPHVVAWPADEAEGIRRDAAERGSRAGGGSQDRRHWHTGCWRRGAR
jgi:hypothetical protein